MRGKSIGGGGDEASLAPASRVTERSGAQAGMDSGAEATRREGILQPRLEMGC